MQLKAPSGGFFPPSFFVLVCENHSEKLFWTKTDPVKMSKIAILLLFFAAFEDHLVCVCENSPFAIVHIYEELEKLEQEKTFRYHYDEIV